MTTRIETSALQLEIPSNYLYAAPAVAALFYPIALIALYSGGRQIAAANSWDATLSGWIVAVAAGILAYAVPATSFWIIYLLARVKAPSRAQVRARSLAHLAFACPPLFTATGVVLYLLHSNADYIVWPAIWIPVAFVTARSVDKRPAPTIDLNGASVFPALRVAHGLSAVLILLMFLVAHIANHLAAVWTADLHKAVMNTLRTMYRNSIVQPALVALFLFQIASGGTLLRKRMVVANDLFDSLQTTSGAYLAAFIMSHLMAVFILARGVLKIESNWDFAIGAPAGLVGDSWNVRLIPHYSLAVCLLFTHLACGLRIVLLAHGMSPTRAARLAIAMMVLGVVVGITITAAMLGAHVGSN
jgi:hypothetical protein